MEEEQDKSTQVKTFIRDTITVLVVAAVIILVLQFVIQKFVVEGSSMNFTLHDGQQLLVLLGCFLSDTQTKVQV